MVGLDFSHIIIGCLGLILHSRDVCGDGEGLNQLIELRRIDERPNLIDCI